MFTYAKFRSVTIQVQYESVLYIYKYTSSCNLLNYVFIFVVHVICFLYLCKRVKDILLVHPLVYVWPQERFFVGIHYVPSDLRPG